jgi:hypothetical protein
MNPDHDERHPTDFARIVRASNGQQVLFYLETIADEGTTLHCMARFDTYQGALRLSGIQDDTFDGVLARVDVAMADSVLGQIGGFFSPIKDEA